MISLEKRVEGGVEAAGVLPGPNFVGKIQNVTVTAGRDAILTCKVEHLRGYKVAWVQVDTQTILTIHNTVITRNPRVGLSREGQNVYNLHLKDVQEEDRGWYMCQINTDPMIKELGFLQVVVPPDFEDSSWSGDLVVRENTNVTLECKARGYPPPTVSWRKEDPKDPTRHRESVGRRDTRDGESISTKHGRLFMRRFQWDPTHGQQKNSTQSSVNHPKPSKESAKPIPTEESGNADDEADEKNNNNKKMAATKKRKG
ncbi:Lachesin [Armadillidium vulgare]|nr:Lachesin [Armadillidium vulgare]